MKTKILAGFTLVFFLHCLSMGLVRPVWADGDAPPTQDDFLPPDESGSTDVMPADQTDGTQPGDTTDTGGTGSTGVADSLGEDSPLGSSDTSTDTNVGSDTVTDQGTGNDTTSNSGTDTQVTDSSDTNQDSTGTDNQAGNTTGDGTTQNQDQANQNQNEGAGSTDTQPETSFQTIRLFNANGEDMGTAQGAFDADGNLIGVITEEGNVTLDFIRRPNGTITSDLNAEGISSNDLSYLTEPDSSETQAPYGSDGLVLTYSDGNLVQGEKDGTVYTDLSWSVDAEIPEGFELVSLPISEDMEHQGFRLIGKKETGDNVNHNTNDGTTPPEPNVNPFNLGNESGASAYSSPTLSGGGGGGGYTGSSASTSEPSPAVALSGSSFPLYGIAATAGGGGIGTGSVNLRNAILANAKAGNVMKEDQLLESNDLFISILSSRSTLLNGRAIAALLRKDPLLIQIFMAKGIIKVEDFQDGTLDQPTAALLASLFPLEESLNEAEGIVVANPNAAQPVDKQGLEGLLRDVPFQNLTQQLNYASVVEDPSMLAGKPYQLGDAGTPELG